MSLARRIRRVEVAFRAHLAQAKFRIVSTNVIFTGLVDILYDRRVELVALAQVSEG